MSIQTEIDRINTSVTAAYAVLEGLGADMPAEENVDNLAATAATLSSQGGAGFRPNLLDNWYFGNPVNQRGETSYTGIVYTIDRWKSRVASQTVSVEDGCIKTSSPTATGYLTQYLESCPPGKYTASVLVKSVSGTPTSSGNYAVLYTSDGTNTLGAAYIKTTGLHSFTFDASVNVSTFQLQTYTGCTIEIVAAKLELGDTQTLTHQNADGSWRLNEIPNYGLQLEICRRYYQRLRTYGTYALPLAFGHMASTTAGRVALVLPTPLRAVPTMTATSVKFSVRSASTNVNLSATPTVFLTLGNVIHLSLTSPSSLNTNSVITLCYYGADSDAHYIELSADL